MELENLLNGNLFSPLHVKTSLSSRYQPTHLKEQE